MAIQLKKMYLEVVVRQYTSNKPEVQIVSGSPAAYPGHAQGDYLHYDKDESFTMRCNLSLQGEDTHPDNARI